MTLKESFANELSLVMFLVFGCMSAVMAIVHFPSKVMAIISVGFFILSYICHKMMKSALKKRAEEQLMKNQNLANIDREIAASYHSPSRRYKGWGVPPY